MFRKKKSPETAATQPVLRGRTDAAHDRGAGDNPLARRFRADAEPATIDLSGPARFPADGGSEDPKTAALQTDATRVVSYRQPVCSLLAGMGISLKAHSLSHYGFSQPRIDASRERDKKCSALFAHFLDRLKLYRTPCPPKSYVLRRYVENPPHGKLNDSLPVFFLSVFIEPPDRIEILSESRLFKLRVDFPDVVALEFRIRSHPAA